MQRVSSNSRVVRGLGMEVLIVGLKVRGNGRYCRFPIGGPRISQGFQPRVCNFTGEYSGGFGYTSEEHLLAARANDTSDENQNCCFEIVSDYTP